MLHRSRRERPEQHVVIDFAGWYGVFAILGAYALLSLGYLAANDIWYQMLNLTGAVGLGLEALFRKDYQPTILNLVWALIACIAIFRVLF